MAWTFPRINEVIEDKEIRAFLREVHTRIRFGEFTWDAPNVPANSTVDTTLTTADSDVFEVLRAGMSVHVTPPPGIDAGLMWGAFCPANEQLTIRLANVTGLAINEVSGTWAFDGVIV